MPKAQKHCKLHDFYAWTVPKKQEKWPKIDQKTPNKNLQNASSNFTIFFPTPNPQKRENPSRLKDFRGGSAAGARPRVAKAMLSFPHYTARHRRIKGCRPCRRPRRKRGLQEKRRHMTFEVPKLCSITGFLRSPRRTWHFGDAQWHHSVCVARWRYVTTDVWYFLRAW